MRGAPSLCRVRARLAFAALGLGLLMVAVAAPSATGSRVGAARADGARFGDFAGTVDIGGRRLHLDCRGKGGPTVVLEAGLRSRGDFWSLPLDPGDGRPTVLEAVSRFTRVCEYDRPGTTLGTTELSRSDPVPMPRTARQTTADLHALLRAARIPGPYVLVGHSTGGLFTQLYARRYPRRIVGMVLVDSLARRLKSAFAPQEWALFKKLNTDPPPGLEDYADLETVRFDRSYRQLRRIERRRRLRRMPLTVISRTVPSELPPDVPAGYPETFERVWQVGQRALARLLPDARHVRAARSGHYVMLERPRLVISEIRRVVGAA